MDTNMKIENCNIPGVKIIYNDMYSDNRGKFKEIYKKKYFSNIEIPYDFVQDNLVYSHKSVLRGLHYQEKFPQGKLISVIEGEIFDVAVDINRESNTFAQWFGKKLSKNNSCQLFIPPGYAHGYCVLSDFAIVMYKCTDYYNKDDQKGIIWNDSQVNIEWPILNPIISDKDAILPKLSK